MQARPVADWLLAAADDEGIRLSNMQLQKLVYLAESAYGAIHGRDLVSERFQAWEHGPVVGALYYNFKSYGSGAIATPTPAADPPEEVSEVLATVLDYFGRMSAAALRTLTHDVGPYQHHFRDGASGITLPKADIHAAWPQFLERAARRKVSSTTARDRDVMKALLERDATEPRDRDVEQVMADYRAFAVSAQD